MSVVGVWSRNYWLVVVSLMLWWTCSGIDASVVGEQYGNTSRHTDAVSMAVSSDDDDEKQCEDGLVIRMWLPATNLSTGDRVARGMVYFIALLYLFIGVSIIADRFMGAIETITSKEKEIKVKKPNGEVQIVVVRVWNETVANLSLMALGSSAPEILLSIIEIYAKGYKAGELGPGTIVGSAAFNLFMIIGLCVYVIPDGEVRKIKHLRVFFVTATWSVFAYVWMYIILAVTSPSVVEIWEGLVTFMFFPATLATAYIADRRMLFYKYISKSYRVNRRGVIIETETAMEDLEHGGRASNADHNNGLKRFAEEQQNDDVREFEEHRREYIQMLRELRKKHPDMDMRAIEALAREELANSGPKSRAFYRIQATRKLTGGTNLVKKALDREASDLNQVVASDGAAKQENMIHVCFDPGHYTVMENVGEFMATVRREGGDLSQMVQVDYRTEDGSANAGSDYIAVSGTLTFGPDETTKQFGITVIDDDVFEEDEHFYIRLNNVRLLAKSEWQSANGEAGGVVNNGYEGPQPQVQLVAPFLATVMILDDDHCGIFNLAEKDIELVESVGVYEVRLVRWSGARGRVALNYRTVEGTAKEGKDYEAQEGEVIFENNEIEKIIPLTILEEDSYEKDVLLYVEISDPIQLGDDDEENPDATNGLGRKHSAEEKVAMLGRPKLGETTRCQIRIKESKEFKNTVDKLVQRANASLVVGSSSWKEQFIEAITVSASDDDEEEGGEEKMPSCTDYVLHFLTVFWKILFAFVPPTDRLDGWLSFVISIIWIGALTAVIGDVAGHFGCTVGLKDSVTAITLVALGTSVPDTFASKVAAVQDKYADASIGNVTGSNAVNVFLGIGIAWSMAAIHHRLKGTEFKVEVGSLAFSVTLFCSTATVAILIMMARRHPCIGGELGGPRTSKIITSLIFVGFWLFYVTMSSLEAYGVIEGF